MDRYELLRLRLDMLVEATLEAVVKTQGFYDQALRSAVRDFYNGEMDGFGFIDKLVYLITEQFTRAWNEGMRSIGLDPKKDMEPEWAEVLQERIKQEISDIEGFASAIEMAAADKENNPIQPLLSRVSMWSNRYNELVSLSIATCGKEKLEWIVGQTDHCDDCRKLNGCVDYADLWLASGWLPQTSRLACGGFRCQCSLVPTRKRRSPGGVDGRMDRV